MSPDLPPELRRLLDEILAAERQAETLIAGLTEGQGTRPPRPGSWSISECLDHMATANRVYLRAMREPAERARKRERLRKRPALPGWPGRLFIYTLEPPARWWSRLPAPGVIRPRTAPALSDAFAAFMASQSEVRAFVTLNADLDLASIRFRNPFVRGIRFSLATGLHVIRAHDRRHLLQAWRVRYGIEAAQRRQERTPGTSTAQSITPPHPKVLSEGDVDYDSFHCCGNEKLVFLRCPACAHIMVFCFECDTLYPDLNDTSHNVPVSLTRLEDRLVCPACRISFADYAFLRWPHVDKYMPTAEDVIAAGFDHLLSSERRREFGL